MGSKSKRAAGYIVVDGFNVNGSPGGTFISADDLPLGDILADAGHVIRSSSDSSGTLREVNVDASEEDENTDE